MARRRNNWTSGLHPRDYRGRFAKKGSSGKRKGKAPTRGRRIARALNTSQQVSAGSLVGAAALGAVSGGVLAPVGGLAGGYVALNRRRNAQKGRNEIGLRSTLTGRKLT